MDQMFNFLSQGRINSRDGGSSVAVTNDASVATATKATTAALAPRIGAASVVPSSSNATAAINFVVKDRKTDECFSLDHLMKAHIERLRGDKTTTKETRARCERAIARLGNLCAEEVADVLKEFGIKSPLTGNDLSVLVDLKAAVKSRELGSTILHRLECPVCFLTVTASKEVFTCDNGHLVCSDCNPRITKCPTCRSAVVIRNKFAERMAADALEFMTVACEFAQYGCPEKRTGATKAHVESCPFRTVACPGGHCGFHGGVDDLVAHSRKRRCFVLKTCAKEGDRTYTTEIMVRCTSRNQLPIVLSHDDIIKHVITIFFERCDDGAGRRVRALHRGYPPKELADVSVVIEPVDSDDRNEYRTTAAFRSGEIFMKIVSLRLIEFLSGGGVFKCKVTATVPT